MKVRELVIGGGERCRAVASAESFAAAAAVYSPDLMLQLEATRRGAVPARPSCHEVRLADRTPALGQPAASDRMGWQDGPDGDLEGVQGCPAR